MGSRILSRSFTVEKWDSGEEEEGSTDAPTNTRDHEMDVDSYGGPEGLHEDSSSHHSDAEEEEEEEEDSSDIAMVPMADMLNAQYRSENVRPHSYLPLLVHTQLSVDCISGQIVR